MLELIKQHNQFNLVPVYQQNFINSLILGKISLAHVLILVFIKMPPKTVPIFFILLVIATATFTLGSRNPVKNLLKALEDRSLAAVFNNQNYKNILNKQDYRLPNTSIPLHYDLSLATNIHLKNESDPEKYEFHGEVDISLKVLQDTDEIVVHSKDHTNIFATLTDNTTGEVIPWFDDSLPQFDRDVDFLKFKTKTRLTAGKVYNLWIKFSGKLRERAERGFYKSFYLRKNGEKSWLVGTQFQSIYARHAFPCYDEPGIRAEFTVTAIHDKSLHALSNMPVETIWKL